MRNPKKTYSREAKQVWREIDAEWELNRADFIILGQLCESLMLLRLAEADIAKNGMTIMSGLVEKSNPAIQTIKIARSGMFQAWKLLNLQTEEQQAKVGRPPGGKKAKVLPIWVQRKSG
jgi:phage terminase small subunit